MSLRIYHRPSPNFNERAKGEKPWSIIIHALGGKHFNFIMRRMENYALELSAHYVIHNDGTVLQMVPDVKRAWHAGPSGWYGRNDMNSASIGIELDNRNGDAYSGPLMHSLTRLCNQLMKRHEIKPNHVLAHSDVSPSRGGTPDHKADPGHHFPWDRLHQEGIATLPEVKPEDSLGASAVVGDEMHLKALFVTAGYPVHGYNHPKHPAPTLTQLVTAFQRHYQPEAFMGQGAPGVVDELTVMRLRALARQNQPYSRPKGLLAD
jgi:N-acetylmuramoyl-L-alanine amidase